MDPLDRCAVGTIIGRVERTVQKCRELARKGELLVDVSEGRMLSWDERQIAIAAKSRQRGLSNVSAFAVPHLVAEQLKQNGRAPDNVHPQPRKPLSPLACGNLHPSQEEQLSVQACVCSPPSKPAPRRENDGAPPRPRQKRPPRPELPGTQLARDLQKSVFFLRRHSPARFGPQLQPYITGPWKWSAYQLTEAMNRINATRGFTALTTTNAPPYGLLRWYLKQIDPETDHPHYGSYFDQP